ncbi:hypothetical protein QFZ75_008177 [Streptomyces sp. V3I8]|uniref:hypothetical protein n=1 Tax=Streptomyces sp. V3I8 TaxID=3042279 RepID=UPI002788BED5|nr:hypothetical protein [Streptomyces sp. V3I8]MDQ1041675.1 hypothetical protein [Streptomyces sp. V3I8]
MPHPETGAGLASPLGIDVRCARLRLPFPSGLPDGTPPTEEQRDAHQGGDAPAPGMPGRPLPGKILRIFLTWATADSGHVRVSCTKAPGSTAS